MKACYAIIKIRSFAGIEAKISLVVDDTGSHYLSFSSPGDAKAWIRLLASRKHYLRDDTTSPTYSITEVGSGNFWDAYKCTWPERVLATSNRNPRLKA